VSPGSERLLREAAILRYRRGDLVTPDGAVLSYLDIGSGSPILFIPGVGDGERTAGAGCFTFVLGRMFQNYLRRYRLVFITGCREPVPEGFGARDFAAEYAWALEQLGIAPVHVQAISGGGPIGQWLAIDRPDLVKSLVLGATTAHTDEHLRAIISKWLHWAKNGRWYEFNVDSITMAFTPGFVRKHRWWFLFLRCLPDPRYPQRMIRALEDLLCLDNRPHLHRITCPALVIGGDADRLIRPELQEEMARLIPNARTVMLKGLGHGAGQEARTEHETHVLSFYSSVEAAEGAFRLPSNPTACS
jgi:pimeloyl-ACP methyl ester carboxylesterase